MALVTTSERQEIEEYLKLYCIEACLDEVLNDIVERRPTNPYTAIAQAIEAKSMPEVIEIEIFPILASNGQSGCVAVVETNISKFSATTAFPFRDHTLQFEMFQDFNDVQDILREKLKKIDPRNIMEVDTVLADISGLDPTVALAVSMACCRAGARHRGVPLYRYLSDLAGISADMVIPMPVVTVLSRSTSVRSTQDVSVIPTQASGLDVALQAATRASSFIKWKLEHAKLPHSYSSIGCPKSTFPTPEEAVKFVHDALAEIPGVEGAGLLPAADFRAQDFFVHENSYHFDGGHSGPNKSADALTTSIAHMLTHCRIVSIEDAIHSTDVNAQKMLKHKIGDAVAAMRRESGDRITYAVKGVGGDESVPLQIVTDVPCRSLEDLAPALASEGEEPAANTLKIRLQKIGLVSKAVAMCKAARAQNWCLVMGTEEDSPETSDTFIADLAVAMGAGQLAAGGIDIGENFCKYNRLLEIAREDVSIPFVGRNFRR